MRGRFGFITLTALSGLPMNFSSIRAGENEFFGPEKSKKLVNFGLMVQKLGHSLTFSDIIQLLAEQNLVLLKKKSIKLSKYKVKINNNLICHATLHYIIKQD